MKHFATACLLAALSAVSVLAEAVASPTVSSPSATTTASAVTDAPELELRQVGLVNPNAALTAATAAGAVTQYEVGGVAVLYTQLFSAVPDQCPYPTCSPLLPRRC